MIRGQKFLTQLAISAFVAVATPALAAGLMTGVSATGTASDAVLAPTIAVSDTGDGGTVNSGSSPLLASHSPARLSALAGDDDAAWSSAHSVHVEFAKRKPK